MQITVRKPNYPPAFKAAIDHSYRKSVTHQLDNLNDRIYITVYSQKRPVGRFTYVVQEDKCVLEKRFVIERDYCPFEYSIATLVKYFKRKKIKYLLWN